MTQTNTMHDLNSFRKGRVCTKLLKWKKMQKNTRTRNYLPMTLRENRNSNGNKCNKMQRALIEKILHQKNAAILC